MSDMSDSGARPCPASHWFSCHQSEQRQSGPVGFVLGSSIVMGVAVPEEADSAVIDDTGRLLEFLAAVAREVQSKPTRDFRRHPFLLLPEEVPEHSRVRLGPREGQPAWLTVPRIQEPPRPTLPEELEGFVDFDSLEDLEGLPHLKEEFSGEEFDEQRLALEDWTESEWLDWSVRTKPIRLARGLYQRVLELRLLAQREQATHEIAWGHCVLGAGVAGGVVAPLLITRVQVELDEETGTLSVIPEGVPELELDPLEGSNIEGMPDLAALRAMVATEEPIDPWDPGALDLMNRRIAAPLGLDAKAVESTELPLQADAPTVTRGWMLVARPRPARHQRFYDDLAEVLKERSFLPESLASVVALEGDLDKALRDFGLENNEDWTPVADRLLMPLPTNDEQERIARQLASARGVTVQGPPGTGKSHTIVNLVSHLMAHGKRVLVTAQNEQALQVLRDKFPPELRDLTVSVLGASPEHMDSLRASIQEVLNIASQVDPEAEKRPIAQLGEELDRVRTELRRVELKLTEALHNEDSEFPLRDGPQRAPEVATWLRTTSSKLGLIPDPIPADARCPLTPAQFSELVTIIRTVAVQDLAEHGRHRPRAHEWPMGVELQRQSERFFTLQDTLADLEDGGLNLENVAACEPAGLQATSLQVAAAAERLIKLQSGWAWKVCREIHQSEDGASFWATMIEKVQDLLANCQDIRRRQLGHDITLPEGDHRQQSEFLTSLSQRFSEGKGVPRLFNSDLRTFYSQCRVDGLEPRSVDEVELLQSEVDLRQQARSLQNVFRQASDQVQLPVPELGASFLSASTQVLKDLEDAQDWEATTRSELKTLLGRFFTSRISLDDPEPLSRAADLLSQGAAQRESETIAAFLHELSNRLLQESEQPNASTKWNQMRTALASRQWSIWQEALDESERVESLGDQVVQWQILKESLASVVPVWTNRLLESTAGPDIAGDPNELLDMWLWRQARTWLESLHASTDVEVLMDKAQDLQLQAERLVIQLARKSTSVAVQQSLTDEKRRALTAWQQALQRVGKGTGKNAATYMQVARSQLPVAMGAIPAWIMPIHRVIDNFDPRVSELFDVVIVDESSQCDLLSVGVLALGRKSVVVGDDKQTSPAAVGVDTRRIQELQNSYLHGIDQRHLLTADESLYGLAERVFPSVILLREHFRCLPEIIRFSNRYYDDRILPLREPLNKDIGDPLIAVRVDDGVRVGSSSNATNHVEAQRLVDAVIECHNDPRYEDMTFGVVTLLGNQQPQIIERMLLEQLGFEAFQERRLRVGNPATFQGDERNVIFISVVADDGSYAAVRTPDKQRINVAASRAQDQMWVFYSLDPGTLNHQDQRRALIEYVLDGGKVTVPQANQLDLCESEFEKDVLRDIVQHGYEVIPQYPVGGYRIDLVVDTPHGRIAVECDGDKYHGIDQYESDIRRQRVLERLGWTFWRIRASQYYLDPGSAMKGLWQRLEHLKSSDTWAPQGRFLEAPGLAPEVHTESPERGHFENSDPDDDALFLEGSTTDLDDVELLLLEAAEDLRVDEIEHGQNAHVYPDEPSEDWTDISAEAHSSVSGSSTNHRGTSRAQAAISSEEFLQASPDYSFDHEDAGLWIIEDAKAPIVGAPMSSGAVQDGYATPCTLGYGSVRVDFQVVQWEDGSGEIRCIDIVNGGPHLNRLRHGGRIGFYRNSDGRLWAELRIMRLGKRGFATAHNPEDTELDEVLGWSLEEALIQTVGAESIGTRADLLGDISGRRFTPVVVWRGATVDVPAFLYVATRVLPLMRIDGDYS